MRTYAFTQTHSLTHIKHDTNTYARTHAHAHTSIRTPSAYAPDTSDTIAWEPT